MARTSENLKRGTDVSSIQRTPTKREQSLSKKNQQLEVENFLLKRQLRTETELKYMFGLFILEDELTDRFNEWNKKGRPEHTDSWKNECLRHIKENLLPNGIRELALKIENK